MNISDTENIEPSQEAEEGHEEGHEEEEAAEEAMEEKTEGEETEKKEEKKSPVKKVDNKKETKKDDDRKEGGSSEPEKSFLTQGMGEHVHDGYFSHIFLSVECVTDVSFTYTPMGGIQIIWL